MASAHAVRSARPLSEVARHVVIPEGIVDTLWFEVEERCREFGDEFDLWQDGLGQAILGLRADGLFAASVGGITLSIPRQVAKTFVVGRICVALCTLFPNLTILWTAHRTRTSTKTFQNLKGLAMRRAVRGYLEAGQNNGTAIRDANGEQAIPFANGSVIMFGAREGGFGRGFDEVDIEVYDEAQILDEKALEDMVAATNQSRWEHGALLFYMGTPPRPTDKGAVFTLRRNEALALKRLDKAHAGDFGGVVQAGDAVYVECSADSNVGQPGGPGLDDIHQVEKANPSYPDRTPLVSIKRLRKNLPSPDSWRREGLGVWDELGSIGAIPLPDWNACEAKLDALVSPVTLAVETAQDRSVSVLLAVGPRASDGITQLEIVKAAPGDTERRPAPGTAWVPARIAQVVAGNPDVTDVVIDGRAAAAPLLPKIRELLDDLESRTGRHVEITVTTTADVAEACPQLYDAIVQHRIRHSGGEVMAAAVKAATWKDLESGGRIWSRKAMGPDAPVLLAMTLGLWKASHVETYDPMANIW